jgi:hypothetical protein
MAAHREGTLNHEVGEGTDARISRATVCGGRLSVKKPSRSRAGGQGCIKLPRFSGATAGSEPGGTRSTASRLFPWHDGAAVERSPPGRLRELDAALAGGNTLVRLDVRFGVNTDQQLRATDQALYPGGRVAFTCPISFSSRRPYSR